MSYAGGKVGARAVERGAGLRRDAVVDAVERFDEIGIKLGVERRDGGVRLGEGEDG